MWWISSWQTKQNPEVSKKSIKKLKSEKSKDEAESKVVYKLEDLHPVEWLILIFLSFVHLFILTVIKLLVSIYNLIKLIIKAVKFCYNHPTLTKKTLQAVYYGYGDWWTFSGVYRELTRPPPKVFKQKTLKELRMEQEAAEAAAKKKN